MAKQMGQSKIRNPQSKIRTTHHPWVRAYGRAGRLVPPHARGLRARCVILAPGARMEWHSTHQREELLLLLRGRVRLDIQSARRILQRRLQAGQAAFLPSETIHQVCNHSARQAQYLYVTGPVS